MSAREELPDRRLNAAIASAVVRIHSKHVGRGPTKAQSFYRNNVVVVTMEHALTRAELTLVADGNERLVRAMRRELQHAMRDELIGAVETITGAKVIAFMSDNHVDPDLAAEVFVLDAPVAAGPAPASEQRPAGPPENGVLDPGMGLA
jgi:uncharacterized protein YbcI